uniref:NADH-ubiquinone oxidoreductase chain 2 n=1 Tax=Mirhipipteryx andensis TaxID=1564103 RepID=A0A0N7AXU4_9ORTH|nr:NADH dehydrogenase subunit 2 [Mirhipipteryx andensis]AJW76420.1 NADH dehydrogenase subunit 2 [Mirhipipteryx andensis]
MQLNSTNLVFVLSLIIGSIMSISASSWFGVWMGLEINLLSFIPLIMSKPNVLSTDSSIKYFIIQALASSTLLLFITLNHFPLFPTSFINQALSSAILLKMGAGPFFFWFPEVMEGLSWLNSFTLLTWQKLAPFMVISYCLSLTTFSMIIIILSITSGALGGLNQTSTRKIMAFSSINHMGWMLMAISLSDSLWMIYFMIYSIINLILIWSFYFFNLNMISQLFNYGAHYNLVKLLIMINLLSLGGLPPFMGFFPKWMILQSMLQLNLMILSMVMLIMSIITVFFYLRLAFSSFLISSSTSSFMMASNPATPLHSKWEMSLTVYFTLTMSIMGLSLTSWSIYLYL